MCVCVCLLLVLHIRFDTKIFLPFLFINQLWYAISKILAEQAAWDFAEQNNINLVTVLPSWVLGSSLPRNLKETASVTLSLLKGNQGSLYNKIQWLSSHINCSCPQYGNC